MHSPPRNHPGLFPGVVSERVFLPQVQLEAHATILQTTSRVTLTQTFINPSATKAIREVKYVFPLYEGISVVAFTCHVADRTIVGEVKEKNEAKQDYTQAVQRGETAGLFEQLDTADTFMTTVGNVPPGVRVVIELTYLGELKHDMEVDGIRFTIPSIISSRYGRTAPGSEAILAQFQNFTPSRGGHSGNILITVDAEMAEGSFIQKILSPSHPISVSMGTTSIAPNDVPEMSKASATLGIQSTHLDTDFVLQIVAKDTGIPKAILETHPTIPNQRALMATLVPKFALPPQSPEIVFVCDRSGSMEGTRIALAKQALQIFLKSLPVGAMFNICSFGSGYSFLWPRSVAYSQKTLDEAVQHVGSLAANYGGTEMLEPLKATVHQRYRDIPLEVMMLTDGAIWNQDILFTYLNEQVQDTTAPIRVYTLGVGSGVSHSLIEGIARAGNGFSQTVGEGEKMDSKVVRMLKGALSPHVNDYSLEVKYAGGIESLNEEEDFEIVERVADSLTVKLDLNEKADEPNTIKPISLFDPSADPDRSEKPASGASNLHNVATPKIVQAPSRIPPLFAFNRTTVYLLLGPDAPHQTPLSVLLRGTSTHGPLELEFPIQVLDRPGTTIHQLAAKKATFELEQGRGWLAEAKDESGKLLKERYESRFSSMMEREAVRLGVQFQVSGKWCSFVAVEKNRPTEPEKAHTQWEYLEDEAAPEPPHDYQMQCMLLEQQNKKRLLMARQEQDTLASASYGTTNPEGVNSPPKTVETLAASSRSTCSENVTSPPKTDDETLALLISVQTFEGEWKYSPPLFLALKIREDVVEEARTRLNHHLSSKAAAGETVEYSEAVWATSLAIVCLETKLASLQGSWELIVDKAKAWLSGSVGAERMEEVLDRAKELSDEISKYDGSRMRSGN
ncbi:uncharacterized protein CC84DRAFT_1079020 [Paraphaeosphaeria sporulosa]|uniref:VIT-domain-containing protein n=1 Tax=Paraphaeosphaeria sporulosa TaxID=1460663 RepID=A0A177CY31_9PLEO|nr:uncharacterized protein CC84DRAFT_1079020 [Paraphaeosphaeria sporulosa]OAG11750.1 hypothetical protein CC84DRAFT_1079020 [Paraphaeosphaeria sporulosa]